MDPSSPILNPAVAAQFRDLVSRLMSSDNVVRAEAEKVYEQMKEQAPEQLVLSLLHLSMADSDQTVRVMSAIMLRQEIAMHKEGWIWPSLTPQTQSQVKIIILHGIQAEANAEVRKKIADVVSELGVAVLNQKDNSWPELFPCLLGMSESNDEGFRVVAMEIFGTIACRIPSSMSEILKDMINFLQKMFRDPSVKVRAASFGVVYGLLQICEEKTPEMQGLQSLIPAMLETIAGTIHSHDVETCEKSLEMLLDLAEFNVVFLRPNILNLIELMFSIAKSPQVDDSLRHSAAEVLVTLSEAKPAMVRKIPNFLPEIFALLLDWSTHLEDNPDWNKGEEEDLDDVDAAIAEESLDRLSICLGGETVSPILFTAIPQFLGSPDWRFRHAGLMSISVSGEGSMKYLSQHLQDVVGMILPFFQDPHPRVRWAACNTIGQMCSDFSPDLQNLFHEPILVNIVQVMNDAENPRVQSHAASAIVNFCEDCGEEVLSPYLQPVLEKLHSLLQSPKIVQEQVVTAIAAIADCVGEKFLPFYDFFAPFLKDILHSALSAEFHVLRSKALECLSIIGVAVGKEKFGADHQVVVNVLSRLHYNPDDPEAPLCFSRGLDFASALARTLSRTLTLPCLD
jgi:importin-5